MDLKKLLSKFAPRDAKDIQKMLDDAKEEGRQLGKKQQEEEVAQPAIAPMPPPLYSRSMNSPFTYNYSYKIVPGQIIPGSTPFPWDAPPVLPPIDSFILDALKSAEPRKVGMRVPDRMEVITAWRAWSVQLVEKELRLGPLGVTGVWEPKKAVEAACGAGKMSITVAAPPQHKSPEKACTCGIWAFHTLDELIPALAGYKDVRVFGQVSLWGKVIECEKGFRAEKAYPRELWLVDSSLEELGHIYGVPVRTVPEEAHEEIKRKQEEARRKKDDEVLALVHSPMTFGFHCASCGSNKFADHALVGGAPVRICLGCNEIEY